MQPCLAVAHAYRTLLVGGGLGTRLVWECLGRGDPLLPNPLYQFLGACASCTLDHDAFSCCAAVHVVHFCLVTFSRLVLLEMIIRSHEVKDNGYEVAHDGKCITVFSAPNYW